MRGKTRGFLCGVLILLSGLISCQVQGMTVPERYSVSVGEPLKISFPVPLESTIKGQISCYEKGIFNKIEESQHFDLSSGPVALKPGEFQVRLSLFGVIPMRDVIVNALPQIKVVPGGQSIGVLIHSQGVMVVDHASVVIQDGKRLNPALEAGLKKGDIIIKIDGEEIKSDKQVKEMVARAGAAGQPLNLEVKRNGTIFITRITPVFCKESSSYRLGLLIKDSAAGIGTLTFYEPESMAYGALGHVITDIGATRPLELSDGKIIDAKVHGINRGKRGQPGEKIGMFQGNKQINGSITKNTRMGIFGYLNLAPRNQSISSPIPVALTEQIHEGEAEILTVLEGEKIEKFYIEIIKVNPLSRQEGKGIVIKVTDERLLEKTGGIIQGMSGSPIIQDNMLVGAVTHVFVNDPTRGYGVPLEWMLHEAGIIKPSGSDKTSLKRVS